MGNDSTLECPVHSESRRNMAKKKHARKAKSPAARRERRRRAQPCYLHAIQDPNETHYDPKRYGICMICAVKLWELAQSALAFDIRGDCISVTATRPTERIVELSTGYEVSLSEADGLEHLFNAIFGETLSRLKDTAAFKEQGPALLYDVCICELHFIAGQLRLMHSTINVPFLIEQFGVQWDRIARNLRRHD